jgi:hypothetical protein
MSGRDQSRVLLIACGALAAELVRIKRLNGWQQLDIQCLPAELHNRPERIAPAVRQKIEENRASYRRILIGYADCGTGGGLDRLAQEYGAIRIPGAHCYEFYAGAEMFEEYAQREIGTFYLTDYLARNFDRLIVTGMGMDRHPEIRDMLFGNYRRLVYLAQSQQTELDDAARRAAAFLNLEYERFSTGVDSLDKTLQEMI